MPTCIGQPDRFVSAEALPCLFTGLRFDPASQRAIMWDGEAFKPHMFRFTFGGLRFALNKENTRTTSNAWQAFARNEAFSPPIYRKGA